MINCAKFIASIQSNYSSNEHEKCLNKLDYYDLGLNYFCFGSERCRIIKKYQSLLSVPFVINLHLSLK